MEHSKDQLEVPTRQALDNIIRTLEDNAESDNYHDYIRIYRKIANIVESHAGETVALKVMLDIHALGGFMH